MNGDRLYSLYFICLHDKRKYLVFDKNETVFLQILENVYNMCLSSYISIDHDSTEVKETEYDEEKSKQIESVKVTLSPLENLRQFMENGGICEAEYLLTRPWFTSSSDLQRKVFRVVMKNRGHLLNTLSGDFEEHIDDLLCFDSISSAKVAPTYLENLYQFMENGGIYAVDYLLTRPWFTDSEDLQQKVFRVVMQNRGHLLNTVSGDFEEHIDSLLFSEEIESIKVTLSPFENLRQFMENGGIWEAEYLLTRPWFTSSSDLQLLVVRLVMQNRGHLLNTISGDFEKHIKSLLL